MLLEVRNVTKFFNKGGKLITALNDVSLVSNRPEVIGLVGLNGAGKTTLINTIAGVLIPDEGVVKINGIPTHTIPGKLVGYPFLPYQDPRMTVGDAIDVLERFYGDGEWEKYAKILGLDKEINTEIQRLSTGWRQRLNVLSAAGQNRAVILFDETTNGLDAITADKVLDVIHEKGKNSVVIFASHIYSHVERVADRVVIIHRGRILADGPKSEILGDETLEPVFRRYIGVID